MDFKNVDLGGGVPTDLNDFCEEELREIVKCQSGLACYNREQKLRFHNRLTEIEEENIKLRKKLQMYSKEKEPGQGSVIFDTDKNIVKEFHVNNPRPWQSTRKKVDDRRRNKAYWKELAEKEFRESARLRAMVQALRSTFEEVEQENEELHVAYAMQQREILTLGHRLELKTLDGYDGDTECGL